MKIASWNLNSLHARQAHLLAWLGSRRPDLVALQETKLEDHRFPDAELAAAGYRSVFAGQKTYNGVALLARADAVPAFSELQIGIPGFEDPQKRAIAATVGDLRIVNLYVVNGQAVGSEKYDYKLRFLDALHDWLAEEIRRHPQLVVLGDFNIAPDDRDVHDPKAWEGQVLCSAAERHAFERLRALGLHDSYRLKHEAGGAFSWWDYRAAGFRRNLGLRIDLVLLATALLPRCRAASIDLEPRSWERPSDHAPVLVELD
ncbi:exodeoxyribonuclease III [Silanimonas sp.]|uniref:exodeoxyribonuclease III n=1 Tax=Silanimonas sp. TaxID=1929290 RepID=UPI001BBD46A2|nr:exodeoxyribonuclease III [Silanimonas sp.]MBS3896959.1 exodeoxyribonuclease III [Silanimonas sp.]MBS3924020.1 exodeoxyribonuclease III [Xanthomonadaceae bacterium]